MKEELKNKLVRAILIRIWIVFIIGLCFGLLISCKTPQKVVTETSQNEKKDIAKDITALDNSQLYEAISRGVQTAINEKLQLSLNQKIYDTDKPVDPGTGKPPLKEENNINLTKETDTQISDSTKAEKTTANNSLLIDKTKDKSKAQTEIKTEQETQMPGWQKIALGIIAVVLLALATYLIRYLVGKFKK